MKECSRGCAGGRGHPPRLAALTARQAADRKGAAPFRHPVHREIRIPANLQVYQ